MYNTWKIDSLRIQLDYYKAVVYGSKLTRKILEIRDTDGEIIREKNEMQEFKCDDGIKYYAVIREFTHPKTQVKNKVIDVTVFAKLLGKEYVNGINKDNVKGIYDLLIKDRVVKMSFSEFLNSKCFDIDVCKDTLSTEGNFVDFTKALKDMTPPTTEIGKGVRLFSNERIKGTGEGEDKNGFGIQWNDRKKSTSANPFIKFYWKHLEMQRPKNAEFEQIHGIKGSFANVARCEFQIRKQHDLKNLFGKNADISFKGLLNTGNEVWNRIYKNLINKVIKLDISYTITKPINKRVMEGYVTELIIELSKYKKQHPSLIHFQIMESIKDEYSKSSVSKHNKKMQDIISEIDLKGKLESKTTTQDLFKEFLM